MVEERTTYKVIYYAWGKQKEMVDIVKRYVCDACGKQACTAESDNIPSWTVKTEIGDLCPSCSNAWENYKKSFIEKMKIANNKEIIS